MTPESVGVTKTSLVMGKHSGPPRLPREARRSWATSWATTRCEDAFDRFKELADRKKHVYDEDIEALVDEEIATEHDRMKVVALTVIAGTMGPQSATLTLDIDGVQQHRAGDRQRPGRRDLQRHPGARAAQGQAGAVPGPRGDRGHRRPGGSFGQARGGRRQSVTARAADPDTLVAAAKAYLGALNKLEIKRARSKPEPLVELARGERRGP